MASSRWRVDESDILDVVLYFKEGKPISEIARIMKDAKKCAVSRHRVVALLQQAFEEELVSVTTTDPKRLAGQLSERFDEVQFRVISSRLRFANLAAQQILEWLPNVTSGASDVPFVAIGGGQTMADLIDEIPTVVQSLQGGSHDQKEWLAKARRLTFINATAGGLATRPELESSYLTCRFAQAVRAGGTEKGGGRSVIHSASLFPSPDEQEVVHNGLRHTRTLVSGVGDRRSAYCIEALQNKGLLTEAAREHLAGELLFHPFDGAANAIQVPGIVVKQDIAARDASGPGTMKKKGAGAALNNRPESAMLVTLFNFQDLCGRPTKAGRSLIVVATCTPSNKEEKARAVSVLLEHGFITHLCVSADLAREILRAVSRRDL